MTLSKKSGALGAFGAVFGLASLAAALATSCRSRDDGGRVESGARDDIDKARNKVSISRAANGSGTYEVRFFHGDKIADGQALFLKWDVVSNYSDTEVDCGRLGRSSSVVNKDQPTQAGEAERLGGFDVEVDAALFQKCATPDNEGNRKISLECQRSGDWNGPKRLEGCVFADEAGTQLIGKGWGLPKSDGEVAPGFGLAEQIADVDAVINYGKICGQRLGNLPAFDCRDGQLIPIKQNGVEIPFGKSKSQQKCDAPAYLGLGEHGQCVPYARVGRLDTGNANVDTVYVCRRYKMGDSADAQGNIKNPWPADKAWHNDVAVIQHDRVSGETCWFQALSGFQQNERPLSTWRVPPPSEQELPADVVQKNTTLPPLERAMAAKDFWILPSAPRTVDSGFACIKCHDSDPFMLSPYVAQVTKPINGVEQYVIPCDPAKAGQTQKRLCKVDGGQGKYSNLSKFHQPPEWRHSFGVAPKDPAAKECVSCHRIGTINTCETWARDSTGALKTMASFRTTRSLSFPANHWMPVRPNAQLHAYATEQAWQADFKKSSDAILNCCNLFKGLPGSQAAFDQKCEQYPISSLPIADGPDPVGTMITLKGTETAIPDGKPEGVMIPLAGDAADKPVRALSVRVVVKHPYIGHVKLELQHAGVSVVLYNGLDAEIPAEANLDSTLKSSAVNSTLQQFVGQSAQGPWTIKATDATKHEKGRLTGADLILTVD